MSLMSTPAPKAPLLVIAVGNPSRGDDAFGPVLAEQLQAWLRAQPETLRSRVELITDQQWVVEHAMDLAGRTRVLFVDAAAQGEDAVNLRDLPAWPQGRAARQVHSHSSSPAQLLALCAELLQTAPPAAHLLSLVGQSFELNAPLSAHAQQQLPQAWACLQNWLQQALPDA